MCFLLIFPCLLVLINFTALLVRTAGNMSKMITFPANQFGRLNIYSFVFHKEKFLSQAKCRQILYHAFHEHCWLLYRSLHTEFMESINGQITTLHYRSLKLLPQLHFQFCDVLLFIILGAEASCCKYKY